jgi:hypothetical protein
MKKWHRDWHLAIGRRQEPKKWTQGNGGPQKKLATACRGMTCHAICAWHKGHCCQGQGKDKAVSRTQKGWTFKKRHQAKLEGINGTQVQDLKKQLRLRKERTSGMIFRKTTELEIMKRTVRSSVRIRKMNVRTL